MIGKEERGRRNYYIIVAVLFLLVIFLWIYLGGWKKQFTVFSDSNGKKLVNFNFDFNELKQRSDKQLAKLAPGLTDKKITPENIINNLVDETLNKSVYYSGMEIRYPDKWILLDEASTSTVSLLASDGEKFFFNSFVIEPTVDLVSAWHAFKKEPVFNWTWKKVKEGYVGTNVNNNVAKIVGLYQASSSTVVTLERQSQQPEKAQDGALEMLITGLRK